jgi:predicted MFS family arabinose efflux permease
MAPGRTKRVITLPRSPVERALTLSSAASSLAKGVLFGVSALFFTTVIGLSPSTVGVGLTIAGVAGMAAAFGSGHLSDRLGARHVLRAATLAQGAAIVGYCFAHTAVTFCLIASLFSAAQGAQRTAQVTMLARHFTGDDRIAVRARLRVVTNGFVGAGSAVVAVALTVGTVAAYTTAMLGAAVLVLASALPLRALPVARAARVTVKARAPMRDRRYLAVAALSGVITIQFGLLTVGMPLWVTRHTTAPAASVALLLVLNTIVVMCCQIRASRLVRDISSAGRAVLIAVLLLVLACALYAAAAYGSAVFSVALLVLAVLMHSFGEILSEAGGWELAFELADPRNTGAYQGISQTGFAVGSALAPAVVTSTAIDHGTSGWLLLGVLFVAAGAGTFLIARRAGAVATDQAAR